MVKGEKFVTYLTEGHGKVKSSGRKLQSIQLRDILSIDLFTDSEYLIIAVNQSIDFAAGETS